MSDVEHVKGWHPGEPSLVLRQYRRHIMDRKRRFRTARSLIHYRGFIDSYLWAKRECAK